jgi:small subunit ribosomal protein S17e
LDRTRSISEALLRRYPDKFTADYETNKKILEEIAVIPSKQLRNHVAGYISKVLKGEEDSKEEPEEPKAE